MKNNRYIAQLLKRSLEHALSPAEEAELQAWAGSDAVYRELMDRLHDGASLREMLLLRHELEQDDAMDYADGLYRAVQDRICDAQKPAPAAKRMRRWLPYAAAVAILLTIGWFVVGNRWSVLGERQLAATEILPGGNRATLTLADGRVINLDETQTGIIVGDEDITYTDGSNLEQSYLEEGATEATELLSLTTPKGGTYQITLPDGSRVWLNANSTLKYPSRFRGDSREVILDGEAYFDISKMTLPTAEGQRIPFQVKTPGQTVKVLGTAFNVSAYADDPATKTTLVEGSVQVAITPLAGASGVVKQLIPGQQAITRGAELEIHEVNTEQYTAWREGHFSFDKTRLDEIMRQLARWYDAEIVYDDPSLASARFSGAVSRYEQVNGVLDRIAFIGTVRFEIQGKRIIVKSNH